MAPRTPQQLASSTGTIPPTSSLPSAVSTNLSLPVPPSSNVSGTGEKPSLLTKSGGHSADEPKKMGRKLTARELQYAKVKDLSLGCLTVDNPLRKACIYLTRSMWFEYFILICVLINVGILGAYLPTDTENVSSRNQANVISEPIFTAIFTFEMVVKIIALDFYGTPNGYFNDGWNILDAVIVLLCYIQLAPGIGNIQSIRTIRLMRVLRSLRIESIEIAMNTVSSVVPSMGNVGVVIVFILIAFGMFALMLFPGVMQGNCAYPYSAPPNGNQKTFWSTIPCAIDCNGPDSGGESCTVTTGDACPSMELDAYIGGSIVRVPVPGICKRGPNPNFGITNFDNVGSSMLTWFVISTLEGWSEVMYNLWHTFGAPVFIAFFFIAFITIVPFFLFNLFTAAFISKYSEVARTTREKRRRDDALARELGGLGSDSITSVSTTDDDDGVKEFDNPLHVSADGTKKKGSNSTTETKSHGARWCRCWDSVPAVPQIISHPLKTLTNHWSFTSIMTLIILANAILLACDAAGTSKEYNDQLAIANLVFVIIFTLEMVFKLFALGLRGYLSVPFNIFDGIIVIISIIEAILINTSPDLLQGGGTSALRAFRLLRVLKLAKSWRRLNKILTAIGAAVPAGAAALLVMLIVIFVFALMGMQLFGGQYDNAVTAGVFTIAPRAHFKDLWWAIVTTFWTMTGENWDYILRAHMAMDGIAAFIFFCAIVAIGTFVFSNMYLAILLDAAGPAAQAAAKSDNEDSEEHMDGGLPSRVLNLVRSFFRFAGTECRDRLPNRGKALGFCACDCLEDTPPEAVDTTPDAKTVKTTVPRNAKGKPSIPVEYLPVAPPSTTRVDIISSEKNEITGAVIYAPASVDTLPPRSEFADPDDPVDMPPLSAAGMRIQVLSSGDARVIPQAPERLPCDVPLSRMKQLQTGELLTTEGENRKRELRGARTARKWRRGLTSFGQLVTTLCGKGTYDFIVGCGKACGLISGYDENDVLAQIPVEKLKEEADAAHVKLDLSIRKTFTPKNLRRPTPHESLGCIMNDSPFRLLPLRITSHPLWERLTMTIILLSTINLALAEPWTDTCDTDTDDNCRRMVNYLYGTDVFITLYFCVELFLKIIAQGLYFDDNAYLRDSWNALDAAIVVVSIISLSVESGPVRALRAFRALRALRPLRMVSRLPGLKLVVNTLLQSLPKVCEICIVSFLFMFIFAIIGTQNFKGAIAMCNDVTITNPAACIGTFVPTGASCALLPTSTTQDLCRLGQSFNFPRRWESLPRNYDDIGESLLTVWELGTSEDWPQRMIEAVDAVGEGKAMERDHNPAAALYFLVVQIVIAWTCFSFFTVVVFDTYNDLKSNAQGTRLLTASQRAWVNNVRLTLLQHPRPAILPPNGIRLFLYRLVKSSVFEWTIMLMIVGNVVALACSHFGMDGSWVDGIEYANYAFTLVFLVEAILKIGGLGWKQYIHSDWHKFDLFLVIAAIISAAVSIDASVKGIRLAGTPIATLLRILRIARLFRMVKASKGLQRVLRTLTFAVPAMGNVFGILALLWFIWSIVGMQIFSGTRYGDWARVAFREGQNRPWLNVDANFDSFPIAFMTVFRISTGDDFNGIMRDLMVDVPYCNDGGNTPNCGDKVLPPLFFIACHFITAFIAIKLFLVVVADAYNTALDTDDTTNLVFKLTRDMASQYRKTWALFDPQATSYLSLDKVDQFILAVEAPLGLKGSKTLENSKLNDHQRKSIAKKFLTKLAVVPNKNNEVHFHTLLHAMVSRASQNITAGSPLAAVAIWTGTDSTKSVGLSLHEIASIVRIQSVWRGYRTRKQLRTKQ